MSERSHGAGRSVARRDIRAPRVGHAIPTRSIVVRNLSEINLIREQWEALSALFALPSPLRTFEYARIWYEAFAKPEDVRVFLIADAERTLGIMPMVVVRRRGMRVLTGLTNTHCLHAEPLIAPGCEAEFAEQFVPELIAHASDWDAIDHCFIYSFDRSAPLLRNDILEHHGLRFTQRLESTFVIDLNQTFEHYLRTELSKDMRKKFRRSAERIRQAGNVEYVHLRDHEAATAWGVLVRVEDSGWKGKSGSSIAQCGPQFTRYYDALVHMLAEQRALHLFQLLVNGHPVAASFGFVDGETFHDSKGAYDEQYHTLSPSIYLLLEAVKDFADNYPEIKRLHLFPWDTGYKERLSSGQSYAYETIVFSPTARGRILSALFNIKEWLKDQTVIRYLVLRLRGY